MDYRQDLDLLSLREKLSRFQSTNDDLIQELSTVSKRLQRLVVSLGFNNVFEAQAAIDAADVGLTYQQFTEALRAREAEVKMLRKELEKVQQENGGSNKDINIPRSINFRDMAGKDDAHELVKSQPRTMMNLPQELIDRFIDQLQHDRKALEACGLVCKAWLPAGRRHLFRSISFTYIRDAHVGLLTSLIKLLGHPYCTFASAVKHVKIWGIDDGGYADSSVGRDGWLNPLLPHLSKLVSVTSLFCIETSSSDTGWRSLIQVEQFAHQITEITLSTPRFATFEEFIESICAFSSLVKLNYEDNGCEEVAMKDYSMLFARSPPETLRILDLTCPYGSMTHLKSGQLLFQWLVRSRTILNTIKLGEIHDIDAHTFAILGSYFKFLGPWLNALEVSFNDGYDISRFLDSVDLSLNTSLQSFELGYHSSTFPQIPRILNRLSGDALTDVAFQYRIRYNTELVDNSEAALAATWSQIDRLLAGPRFPCLKTVGLRSYIQEVLDLDKLKSRLKHCIARGIKIYIVNLRSLD